MALSGSFNKSYWDGHYKLIVEWTASQNVSANTSTITAKIYFYNDWALSMGSRTGHSITINGTKYSFNSSAISTTGKHVVATITSGAIGHNSDGTKSVSMSCSFNANVTLTSGTYGTLKLGTVTASASPTLDTIPRKSSFSAGNGTLGVAQTITITKANSAFTHSLTYEIGSTKTTFATKTTASSVSFTPPLSLASNNTTGTSISLLLICDTYSGNTYLGTTTRSISCAIPSSVKPSCSVSVTDATGYETTYGNPIKGLSKFKITVTGTQSYGSPISKYSTTVDGSSYSGSSFATTELKSSGTVPVKSTVTDKRGRTSSTATVNKTVIDYNPPQVTKLNVSRCNSNGTPNDNGEYVKVTFSTKITALSSKNSASYTLKYRKNDNSATFTSVSLSTYSGNYAVTDGSYVFKADSGSSYEAVLEAKDNFKTTTVSTSASTASAIMHWPLSGNGMSVGKVSELENTFDVAWTIYPRDGFINPVIPAGTDLNAITKPGTYSSVNTSSANYLNCPMTSGTFTLEVSSAGDAGQLMQRLTMCKSVNPKVYIRHYYTSAWGEWIDTQIKPDNKVLCAPGMYMTGGHVATLSEPISKQRTGITLVFSYYDGTPQDYSFVTYFVPKALMTLPGNGHAVAFLDEVFANATGKYLYIDDTEIRGYSTNSQSGTGTTGVKYNNARFVLRYVIGC